MTSSIFLYSALVFLTALSGGLLPLVVSDQKKHHLQIFVCLGAGLLLGLALLHMLPEAAKIIPNTFGIWFLTGFLLLLFLERFLMVHPCEEHGCDFHTVGIAAFLGLTVHGIIEGFALASSLFISNLGPIVLISILAHKAPQGFALTSILRLAQKTRKQIFGFSLGVALSGPVGAIFAFYFLSNEHLPDVAGILLAISSGTFLYIGACDLLPEVHRHTEAKYRRLWAFMSGIALSGLTGFFLE